MKAKRFISMMMVLVCSLMLACPAFAVEARASELIKTYSTNAAPSAGSITATFSVTSNSSVSKLGCSSITLYEKSGSSWKSVASKSESDSGMTKSNAGSCRGSASFSSKSGTSYKVVIKVFAENRSGRDTRTETHYVTGK